MKPIKPIELLIIGIIIITVICGVIFLKAKLERNTLICESGAWNKNIQLMPYESPMDVYERYRAANYESNVECKWVILKDNCFCRKKGTEEWYIPKREITPLRFKENISAFLNRL